MKKPGFLELMAPPLVIPKVGCGRVVRLSDQAPSRVVGQKLTKAELRAQTDRRVLESLTNEWQPTFEIEEMAEISKSTAQDALGRLLRDNKVERKQQGKGYFWRLRNEQV